jgi:site-specific recombinase XerD
MAKPIRFTPKRTANGWRLNIPPKISETGKRQQLFYRTQALALAAADDLKRKVEIFGVQTRAIAPSLAEKATAAAALLAPYGIDLLEAARIVAAIRERETASCTLAAAADAWLVACEGLRTKTTQGYRQTANRLKAALGERILSTLSADDLQKALVPPGTPPTSAAGHIGAGKAFWNWSAEKGWCLAVTFKPVKLPKTSATKGEIEILTPAETENLLRTAEKHFPRAVASYALQLFAGIRAEEITRLEATHVTADGIRLPAAITKKGRSRHITPSKTLAAWLEKYPFEPCPNWRRVDRAVRYLAGWNLAPDPDLVKLPEESEKDKPKAPRPDWPQNALRHSHASYSVADGVDINTLLFEFGHSASPAVLRAHYVGLASTKQALAYFAIAPEGMEIPRKLEVVA